MHVESTGANHPSEFARLWVDCLHRSDANQLDRWCSSLAWSRSVNRAFNPDGEVLAFAGRDSAAAFTTVAENPDLIASLELVWLFGAPVVGDDPWSGAHDAVARLRERAEPLVVVGGYVEGSAWWHAFVDELRDFAAVYAGDERARCRASLEGGLDGYLSRRSRVFRRNLRQAERRAAGRVSFEVLDRGDPVEVMARLHRIEQRSWKGLEGSGIESEEMSFLYSSLVPQLLAVGGLRVTVALDSNGIDAGFVLGGVLDGTYRGLQISFTEEARDLGIGNLLQLHELRRLTLDDTLHTYDIGMDMEYKRQWTESLFVTRSLIARRH